MNTTTKRRLFQHRPAKGEFEVFGRSFRLPQGRGARIALGIALIIGGMISFLPVLGVWMIPAGLLVLSQDFARVRRWRRSLSIYFGRRWRGRK